jgi:hypothetical protein
MIIIWYRHHGQRPSQTQLIRDDANKTSQLPSSFEVVGVTHGRRIDTETVDSTQFGLRVNTSDDTISQSAIDAIATAFEDNWGGSIEFVESVV